MVADRVCNVGSIPGRVATVGCMDMIPSRAISGSGGLLIADIVVYAGCNIIKWFFGKTGDFRRVATRCDRHSRGFLTAVAFATARFLFQDTTKPMIEAIVLGPAGRISAVTCACPRLKRTVTLFFGVLRGHGLAFAADMANSVPNAMPGSVPGINDWE